MNNRYFDYKSHAVSSARKLISAYSTAGNSCSYTADELTQIIIAGVIDIAVKKAAGEDKKSEIFSGIISEINSGVKTSEPEKFDECVNITAVAFKTGSCRNDYQFFWNMLKEAMYCVEGFAKETYNVSLDASTISYHISNAAKETVGAIGLKYASDQLVF